MSPTALIAMDADLNTFASEPLVQETAARLRSASQQGCSRAEMFPLRTLRNALMLNGYFEGKTLEEVGEPFGLTRERVRQVIEKLTGPRQIKRIPIRYRRSAKARVADRERGKALRISGERQRNPERNREIERLVTEGLSYAQVARALGVTRNVVCTVMYRANHREDELTEPRRFPRRSQASLEVGAGVAPAERAA